MGRAPFTFETPTFPPPPVLPQGLSSLEPNRGSDGRRRVLIFLSGLVLGGLLGALAVISLAPMEKQQADPAKPVTQPASQPAQSGPGLIQPTTSPLPRVGAVEPPAPPRIHPRSHPAQPPQGERVSPEGPGGPYELPGTPGRFSYEGVSFRYPRSWELTPSDGYWGLVGNNLWLAPIGIDSTNRVLIMANYFPWDYSPRQMRGQSRDLLESLVASHNGTALRAPSPVETGGVTVHWADFAGRVPSGAEVLTRMYHFAWNDVEYYFACQEELESRAGIIRGCDQIFSTLRLG